MNLTKILRPECIKVPLEGKDKQAVINELIDVLNDDGQLLDRNEALEAVMIREKTRSTGIGSGIAIPHAKCRGVKELVMSIGVAKEPIDFQSVDDKPVSIVIMLISPAELTGPHIQALAKISRLMLDEPFRQSLIQAESPQQLYELLSKKDSE